VPVRSINLLFTLRYITLHYNSNVASLSGPVVSIQCSFVTADSGQIYDDDDDDDDDDNDEYCRSFSVGGT